MRILQVGMGNVAGGLESFVMNYYRTLINMDVQFDFICMYNEIAYVEEIRSLGGKVYYVPNVKKNYIAYAESIKKILRENTYDVVHVNMLSAANIVPLQIAHKAGIKKVIAHSHSSSCPGLIRKIMTLCNRPKIAKYATDMIACGELAGKWMFGKKAFDSGKIKLINNAIRVDNFLFSVEKRENIRKKLGWKDKYVIGHVGRFDIPKNHARMITIFENVLKEKENAILCFVGPKDGLYEQIMEMVKIKKLENKVIFVGKQDDIQEYLSAMDVFLFPSHWEGVPYALIEAQTNGLTCVISDVISEEVVFCDELVIRLSLKDEDKIWVAALLSVSEVKRVHDEKNVSQLRNHHFDIEKEAIFLRKLYFDNVN